MDEVSERDVLGLTVVACLLALTENPDNKDVAVSSFPIIASSSRFIGV